MVDVANVLAFQYPTADPLFDYRVSAAGDVVSIVQWNDKVLGPQPTDKALEDMAASPAYLAFAATPKAKPSTISPTVKDFGAKGDGVTDDTKAIQDAVIASRGSSILFPAGVYVIRETIRIGDGTSSAVSTRQGMVLRGEGLPCAPVNFTGYPLVSGVRLKWAGGAAPLISVNGPLQGWGIQNIGLDGQGVATRGIQVTSAQFGDSGNLYIQDCLRGISSTTHNKNGYTGVSNVDALHNKWRGLTIQIPNIADSFGIVLENDGGIFNANTDYNVFDDYFIQCPLTAQVFCLYLQAVDSNSFMNGHLSGTGLNPNTVALNFDYANGGTATQPSGNTLYNTDFGSVNARIINAGTPNGAAPNRVLRVNGANGAPGNPGLPNLVWEP